MAEKQHIAIAGAGVIGLSCALELRRRGLQVTVFEAGAAMQESSWAAGGMLAVDDPENPAALHPLSVYSRGLYEEFLARITRLCGYPIPLRTHQTLQQAPSRNRALTASAVRLMHEEACEYLPGLNASAPANTSSGWLLLDEASLDPRDLCTALPLAVRAAGVDLREHQPVLRVSRAGKQVKIDTAQTTLEADGFLNCSGAWSGALSASAANDRAVAITPRKGQMMVVSAPHPPLTCVLRSPEIYVIPRGQGRLAIGATVEDAGFSKTVEKHALDLLRGRGAEWWPAIADAPLLECWAGLRPATEDGLPLLGAETSIADEAKACGRRWIAAGHYRNGILLAPGTACCMAALILGEQPPVELSAFAPDRRRALVACDKHFAAAL